MPSTSKKQHNFMAAVANNPKFAKKVGVPRSVGEEFLTADKGKTFKEGGEMKNDMKKMANGGMPMNPKAAAMMKKRAMMGARPEQMQGRPMMGRPMPPTAAPAPTMPMKKGGRIASKGEHPVQKQSKRGAEIVKMAGGGYVKSADGIAKKGKTKATMVKMAGGGMGKIYC